jgi:cold shock CspA family protein
VIFLYTGYIKWYRDSKGYGFIRYADESGSWHEVFFHRSQIDFNPMDGQFVSFLIRDGWKGPMAVNVQRKKAVEVV